MCVFLSHFGALSIGLPRLRITWHRNDKGVALGCSRANEQIKVVHLFTRGCGWTCSLKFEFIVFFTGFLTWDQFNPKMFCSYAFLLGYKTYQLSNVSEQFSLFTQVWPLLLIKNRISLGSPSLRAIGWGGANLKQVTLDSEAARPWTCGSNHPKNGKNEPTTANPLGELHTPPTTSRNRVRGGLGSALGRLGPP